MIKRKGLRAVLQLDVFCLKGKGPACPGGWKRCAGSFGPKLLLIGLLVVLSFSARAQKALKTGDLHFQKYEYALALEQYKKAAAAKDLTPVLARKMAACYRLMNNAREAERWYEQVIQFPSPEPADFLYYAEAARRNGHYLKAKQLYLTYAELMPAQEQQAMQLIATCENAQAWMARPESYEISRQQALSSGMADFSPVYYQQGVVFTSDRPAAGTSGGKQLSGWTGNAYAQLFYSKGQGDSWSAPQPLPAPVNTHLQNGSAVFSRDQQTVVFTRINKIKVKNRKVNNDPFSWMKFDSKNEAVNRLELYFSTRQGESWTEPVAFPYNKASEYSVGHPALSPDDSTLYFVSDMPGGLGETDLYFSRRQADGTWGVPVNLGPKINTAGKEMFPTMSSKGVLHFSSAGHAGMGGLDIFAAEGAQSSWQQVRNLKYPLNSPQDDFGFLVDSTGEAGLVSSNRESTDGTDDIYSFRYVRIPCQLAGQAVEKIQTKPGVFKIVPVGKVQIRLYRQGDTTAQITYSDAAGNFTFPILDGLSYTLKATKAGYLTRSAVITPDCKSTVDMVSLGMVLNRNTLNRPILIENIYYDLDKWDIRPDAAVELDKLVQTLKDNPGIKIELSSHTDSRQTRSYNQLLSQLRAESVVTYIVSKGIAQDRLVARGYGENQLLNRCNDRNNCSEEEHQLNRRTEFKLLKVK
jgi:outer membrane protein OmpA-like peptidoglycan-associated protein/tetratricopeptide (TPR) repeat protein